MDNFQLAIVGGGPGGYVAAIRAAKLDLTVALIEGRDLGGTCLNRGCIPSKTLLKHAHVMEQISEAKDYGIYVNDVSFKLAEMVERKNKVVQQLRSGINSLLKQNKITLYEGFGQINNNKKITITSGKKDTSIQAENVILATGSKPFIPNISGLDQIDFDTSDTIFDIKEVPKHMVIVGGGVIGLEIACVFANFGSTVEVIEMGERILPSEDPEAAQLLAKKLQKDGITFHTESEVTHFEKENDQISVTINKDGEANTLVTNHVLISVGRQPNKTGIEELNLIYNGPFVKVDEKFKTSIQDVYAIGDLIGGYQLAHAASDEGIKTVHHIANKPIHDKQLIPRCVYTFPEIATVGMSEEEARTSGLEVKVKKVDIAGNGKAIAAGETLGFMKIIAEQKYGEIVGVVMVGSHVTEMISQATAIMYMEGTAEELDNMVFPHPTISEAFSEAGSAWLEMGIHYS